MEYLWRATYCFTSLSRTSSFLSFSFSPNPPPHRCVPNVTSEVFICNRVHLRPSFWHRNCINISCFSWNLSRSLFFRTRYRFYTRPVGSVAPRKVGRASKRHPKSTTRRQKPMILMFRRLPLCDPTTVCCPSGHPKHPRLHF